VGGKQLAKHIIQTDPIKETGCRGQENKYCKPHTFTDTNNPVCTNTMGHNTLKLWCYI